MTRAKAVKGYLLCAAVLLLTLTGCSTTSPTQRTVGQALSPLGGALAGPHGFDTDRVQIGHVYGFAFPGFANRSKTVVKIQRVFMNFIPANVVVTHYGVLSLQDSDDYYLIDSAIGSGTDTDYSKFHDYGFGNYRIRPGQQSNLYPIVEIRATGRVTKDLSGCTVDYLEGTAPREQHFPCIFSLDGN